MNAPHKINGRTRTRSVVFDSCSLLLDAQAHIRRGDTQRAAEHYNMGHVSLIPIIANTQVSWGEYYAFSKHFMTQVLCRCHVLCANVHVSRAPCNIVCQALCFSRSARYDRTARTTSLQVLCPNITASFVHELFCLYCLCMS